VASESLSILQQSGHQALREGLRHAASRHPSGFLLPFWAKLADGTCEFEDFAAAARLRRGLSYLTIDTTGACDLKCAGMCYYNPAIPLNRRTVGEEALVTAIQDAARDLDMRVLAFAGKEPFLNAPRLFSLMEQAARIPDRSFLIGVVSNGRHVAKHADALRRANDTRQLDYIDISIDTANSVDHDLIRGVRGTHDRATAAVEWLNRELTNVRTSVVSVLRGHNDRGLLDLPKRFAGVNTHYQIQPIQPPPGSPLLPLTPDYIVGFLGELCETLGGPLAQAGVHVTIELSGIYLLEAVRAGFFTWSELQEDTNCTVYVERMIGGNTLVITCEVFPLQAWRLARITYTGAYLAHMHFLQSPDPDQFAVGYVDREPLGALFDRAMAASSHFGQIVRSREGHDCAGRPCWENCFGGWNGAENAFLENRRKLSEQPRLCTKTIEDFVRLEGGARV
jgi:MoaA/NifB/PqqE/SkfB family radical SAM enzyme